MTECNSIASHRFSSRTCAARLYCALRRGEAGSAAVEMAAAASVLFLMLVGVMKLCLAIYAYHYVSEAAREGARYAIVRGSSCVSFPSACPATTGDISSYVKGLGYPGISSSAMTVSTTYAGYPSGVTCTPKASCNNPSNMATVSVQYAFPLSIPFFGSTTWTMSSTAAMVISQ